MKKLLLIALFLSSCGEATPCERAEMHPQGLCVIPHKDFEINDFILARILFELELLVNDTYPEAGEINIADFFRKHEAYLEYVKRLDSTVDVLGIRIEEQLKSLVGSCWLHYWVPAHEALHLYLDYYLGVTREANATHQVEYAYVKWADANDVSRDATVEWKLAKFSTRYCGIPYQFLPEMIQVDDALGINLTFTKGDLP